MSYQPLPTTISELAALCFNLFLIYKCAESYKEAQDAKRRYNEAARLHNDKTSDNVIKLLP